MRKKLHLQHILLLLFFFVSSNSMADEYILSGKIVNSANQKGIGGAKVQLYKVSKVQVDSTTSYDQWEQMNSDYSSNGKGLVEIKLQSEFSYVIICIKDGFYAEPFKMESNNIKEGEHIKMTIPMSKGPSYMLSGKVQDENMNLVAGAKVILKDLSTKSVMSLNTDPSGNFQCYLRKDAVYELFSSKHKFFNSDKKQVSSFGVSTKDDITVLLELQAIVVGQTVRLPNFDFDINDATVNEQTADELEKLYQILSQNPSIIIEVRSHTDSRGDNEHNLKLSQKRADNVALWLIERGLADKRVTAKGYGEELLVNECADGTRCSSSKHQENRRIEYKIIGFLD